MTIERHVPATPLAGAGAADVTGAELARETTTQPPGIGALITWIPGEVIAAYGAVVLALQPTVNAGDAAPPIRETPIGWFIGAIVFAALLTWLGAWSKSDNLTSGQTREVAARVVFAALAFAIWSFVVPGSWWYSKHWVADNATVIPIVAGIVGLALGLVAEGTVRRVGK